MESKHIYGGSARVELTSADISGIFRKMNGLHIQLFDLQKIDDLTVQFTLSYRNLKIVEALMNRNGDHIKVISYGGLFWLMWRLKARPFLILGVALILFLSVFLPSRVLFVEVEGNVNTPYSLILETARNAGIGFGASRRAVRSEKMKNELLSMLPQLQWAGINTYGCKAVISVRERASENREPARHSVSRIIASCDGVITEYVVTRGSGSCGVGQVVQKGQVLISGYTDCGGVVTAGRAEGEVFAQTRHKITAVTLPEVSIRSELDARQTKYSLCIGKKRINLYKGSGISDGSCVKMIAQYHLTLPGGYVLPLSLIKEQHMAYQIREEKISTDRLFVRMSAYVQILLRSNCVALSVVDAKEFYDDASNPISLTGVYSCIEMIGREQGEQIGVLNDETD